MLTAIGLFFFKNPLGQKIGIVLICLIAAFIALNWYGNRQFQAGKGVGIGIGAEETRKNMEKSWKIKEDNLKIAQEEVSKKQIEVDKRSAEIVKMKKALDETLIKIKTTNQTQQESANAIVAAVPGDMLDSALRNKSRELGKPKAPILK